MALDSFWQQAAQSWRWRAAAAIGVLAIATTALLGGFGYAPRKTPAVVAGERVTAGALAVTAQRAWISAADLNGRVGFFGDDGDVLVLEALVENLTDASTDRFAAQDLRWLVSQQDAIGSKPERVLHADDFSALGSLHPRLPTRVLFCWKLVKDQQPAQPLRFGLYARSYVKRTYLTTEAGWVTTGPGATLRVQADDRRARTPKS